MKLFGWKSAIILIIVTALLTNFLGGYVNSHYSLGIGMFISGIFPLVIIFYFIAWVAVWNQGKAESPFKLIIDLLSK